MFTHEQRTELLWVSQDGKLERVGGAGDLPCCSVSDANDLFEVGPEAGPSVHTHLKSAQ
uniref:Uncharacterized protein n=1 Tax=Anguilla anguilla TaxID=7936 RepID=A0A0E9S520_ANGAN